MFEIILRPIDNFLNRITMYRLVLYYLIVLFVAAVVFCFTGLLAYDAWGLIANAVVLVAVSVAANKLFGAILKIPTNAESDYITALILTLIVTPGSGIKFLILVAVFAQASKYLIAYRGKHIFNPAAIAVIGTVLVLNEGASWWIGSVYTLPIVLIGGLLITRKTQRFDLVLSFLFAHFATLWFTNSSGDFGLVVRYTLINSAIPYFAGVMLTEPLTTPPTRPLRMAYGILIGVLSGVTFTFGRLYSSPELALIIGNVFSFFVSPKGRLALMLKSKSETASGIYEFIFEPNFKPQFKPGQYLDWTLPWRGSDSRGNRRYFTIASSPTENDVHLGVRFYPEPSSFKVKLKSLNVGDRIFAGQLSGEFTMPKKKSEKLVFMAGGIGVTPFRSMIKYLIDNNEKRDIVFFYANKTENEIAFKNIFEEAKQKLGIKVLFVNSETDGWIDAKMVEKEVSDFAQRTFYISGSRATVQSFEKILHSMGVSRTKIKVDFFPGFV